MLIIEGLDNTGKTTLINKISAAYHDNLPIIKSSGPPKDINKFRSEIEESLSLAEIGLIAIHDRYHLISELVYGKVLRGQPLAIAMNEDYWCRLFKIKPLIIYCKPAVNKIRDFGSREQMSGVKENSDLLLKTYDSLIQSLFIAGFKVICYDYEKMKDKEILKIVKNYIKERRTDG